ncbi:MAG: FAD-dependent monooxygenase [Endozoicomonas sp. (ex Botrylloides leachii)]|nr:FAD-dependent monooxygenase [Endozoicomonas sp. (ex Botrylloides leachii)]
MNAQHADVLIVGAGMVGSALAIALARNNISVALFDKAPPKPFSPLQLPDLRVSALSYASEQILKQLNAWEHMASMRMCPYRKMAVWEQRGNPFNMGASKAVFDAIDIGHDQLGFIVENRVTQLGLHRALREYKNIDLLCPVQITKIDVASRTITLNDGRRFQGKLIVGSDGAHSQVRRAAKIGLSQKDYDQLCLVSTVEIEGGAQDITWQAFTPTGPKSFLPLPSISGSIADKNYASIVWYNTPDNIKRLDALDNELLMKEIELSFPNELPPIIRLHERGSFPLVRRHAHVYYKPAVVLVGDAAHTINPLAGQGVNLGFQDAAWLAEILIDAHRSGGDIGSSTVLSRYEKVRRPENQKMMTIMDLFYHAFSNDHIPLKVIRNLGIAMAGRLTPALKQVMKYAMGISGNQPKLAKGQPLS